MDVEEAKASPAVSSVPSREFEFGEHKVQISAEKANLEEFASIQIRDTFRHQGRMS